MSAHLKPRAVLFDLYGTLLDIWTDEYRPEVWEILARFLRYCGIFADARALCTNYHRLAERSQTESQEAHPEVDVAQVFRTLLTQFPHTGSEQFVLEVTQLFRALTILHFELYPDTLPALRELHGHFSLGLVTDAQRPFLDPELEMIGLRCFLDVVIVSSDHGFQKPDPRLFELALKRLRVPPAQAIYVGNSIPRDICGAQDANLCAILIDRSRGVINVSNECQPFRTFHTLVELADWLLKDEKD